MAGNLTHAAGTIALGAFNLSVGGAAPSLDAAGAFTGTGTLIFSKSGAQTLNVTTGTATIAVPVQMNMPTGSALTITGNPLTVTGIVTLTKGALTPTAGINVNGSDLYLTANSSVAGAGVLTFAPASSTTLTVHLAGATTFDNLTINGNVTLAGTAGALTITNVLTHTSGLLNFADRDLIVGTLTRGAGTYSATTGYLQLNTGLTQGTGFSIPNLRINANMTVGSTQNFVVINNLYLNAATLTHTNGSARLTLGVASGAVPTVTIVGVGNLDAAPAFAQGMANYVFTGTAVTTVNATSYYWLGANTAVANDVTDSQTGAGTLDFATNRTINGNLYLTSNILNVDAATTLTLATSGATITRSELGSIALVNATTSILTAANVNVTYTPTVTTAVAATVGPEYISPVVVNNVTDNAKLVLTINAARTIAGNLVDNYNVIILSTTTVTGNVSGPGDLTVTSPAALYVTGTITITGTLSGTGSSKLSGNVTLGSSFTGTLEFVGATGQTITVPSGGSALTNMIVHLTGTNPVLNVTGGNLTVGGAGTGSLTFINGILNMNGNTLTLSGSGQGFTGASQTVGYVVGSIAKALAAGATGRVEYPVGTNASYRMVAFTFLTTSPVTSATTITVGANDVNPYSVTGFPLTSSGISIDTTAGFAWQISSSISLGPSQKFDIEFTGTGFLASNYPSGAVGNLRIVSRLGNVVTNPWISQDGTYQNFEAAVGLPIARVNSTTGGNLISQGATFAIGFTKPAAILFTVSGTVAYSTSGTPIGNATVKLTPATGTALTVTSGATGTYSIANVPAGTYTLTATKTGNWGGVTGGDALIVARHAAGIALLTGLPLTAADVNNSASVTAADALLIVRRAAGLDASFAAGDWVFASQSVTVASAVTANVTGLAVGDVNASYTPSTGTAFAKSTSMSLANGTDRFAISNSSSIAIGSVTMKISANSVITEITSKLPGFVSQINGSNATLVWYAADAKTAFQLNTNDAIATVKLADKAAQGSSVSIATEMTDISGEAVMSKVAVASLPTEFSLMQNYPNPFNPSTQISYNLPQAGKVTLTVYNLMGQEVAKLVNEQKNAGSYSIEWAPKNLASGMYIYRINVQTEKELLTSSKRLMLLK